MQPLPDDNFLAAHDGRDPVVVSPEVRLMLAVVLELTADTRTRHEPIRVGVQNDVVILGGEVTSWTARRAAAEVALSNATVGDVCNVLRVSPTAGGDPAAGEFDLIVGSLLAPAPAAAPVRRRPAAGLVGYSLLVLLWLALPLTVIVTGLPAVPVLLSAVALTAVALCIRRR